MGPPQGGFCCFRGCAGLLRWVASGICNSGRNDCWRLAVLSTELWRSLPGADQMTPQLPGQLGEQMGLVDCSAKRTFDCRTPYQGLKS
jgi:hypothetical protein